MRELAKQETSTVTGLKVGSKIAARFERNGEAKKRKKAGKIGPHGTIKKKW